MILTATATPQRFVRDFQKLTLLTVQVLTAGATLLLGSEQGEVSQVPTGVPQDGLRFFDHTTGNAAAATNSPLQYWWKGELWFSSSQAGGCQFVIIINGEQTEPAKVDYERFGSIIGDAVSRKLDTLQYSGKPK